MCGTISLLPPYAIIVWTGTISPLPFARLTIQNDAYKLKHTKVKYASQSCLHILLEERCLSFPETIHAEILCTSDYFKFEVLKQNTFTKKDIIKMDTSVEFQWYQWCEI